MSKKHFIALANTIREHNRVFASKPFTPTAISALADFCQSSNPRFNRDRWLAYIAGECGPSGGKVKAGSR
jgi:hypothetical protein